MIADSNLGPWKVGELARLTAITVRALHHYDEIGLLIPSEHTESGHRLYTRRELLRLQHIVTLRHLGFSLEQIGETLNNDDPPLLETIKALHNQIRSRRIQLSELEERLEVIQNLMTTGEMVSTQQLLELIETITMYEKYLTTEQIAKAAEIERQMKPERVEEITKVEWPKLIAETHAELERGTDPTSPKVRALALQWKKLIDEKTAGDKELAKGYGNMVENEPAFGAEFMTAMGYPNVSLPRLLDYIGQALATK
jgi:DNA-binding transcriptional MerR regulator